jgi:universal stress protein A
MLKYRKILCPIEFDGSSKTALHLSGALAKESNANLLVLHIARVPTHDMDVPLPFDSDPRWEKEARAKLARIVRKHLKDEVPYVTEVRTGAPDIDIVRAVNELGADLIVMFTHGRHGFEHFLRGSVTEQVIRDALCPVLVLHQPPSTSG